MDPWYRGGDPLRTIDKGGYRVVVHQPVRRRWPLERWDSFVQLTWRPVCALPARVSAMTGVGKQSLSCLIARVNDSIVVRVPLRSR